MYFIILYIQECLNHGGSNSIQGGSRKFLRYFQHHVPRQSSWKYVKNINYMNVQLSPLSLNLSSLAVQLVLRMYTDAANNALHFLIISSY